MGQNSDNCHIGDPWDYVTRRRKARPWTRPLPLGCTSLLTIGFASTACVIVNLRDNGVAVAGAAVAAAAVAAEAAALSCDEFQFAKRVGSGA